MQNHKLFSELSMRISELEQREAFHEITIETLNQCIIDQQKMLDQLKAELGQIKEKLISDKEESIALFNPESDRPPHY